MKASDNTTRNRNLSAERENGERTNEKVVAEREISQCSIGETQFRNLSMEAQTDSAFNPQLLLD
jgi:hypothetical protein